MFVLFNRINEQKLRDSVSIKSKRGVLELIFQFTEKIPLKRGLFLWFVSFGQAKEMNILKIFGFSLTLITLFISCKPAKICNKLITETYFYSFNEKENKLIPGNDYDLLFGNVLIEDCNLKNSSLSIKLNVVDVYSKDYTNSNLKVYLFRKTNEEYDNYILLKENIKSARFNLKLDEFKKGDLLVFKFNNSWKKIRVKKI